MVPKIDALETDLSGLRDKLQQAEDASRKLTADSAAFKSQLADAEKKLAAEQEKSASLWDSLRHAQEVVRQESDFLVQRFENVERQFRDIRRNFAPAADKGKEAMSSKVKEKAELSMDDKGGRKKKRGRSNAFGADVLTGPSSSKQSKSLDVEWGLRTDLVLEDMRHPNCYTNKGEKRNVDVLEAFKEQLGRNLSTSELHMIVHHNGPLLGVESAVYVGSAVSKTCRNDKDWYLQFDSFFLGFFRTLRKAYDHVSSRGAEKGGGEAGDDDDDVQAQKAPISRLGSDTSVQFTPPGTATPATPEEQPEEEDNADDEDKVDDEYDSSDSE